MSKTPKQYVAPLKSREDIVGYLLRNATTRHGPFAFNVKAYADFSLNHLIAVERKEKNSDIDLDDPEEFAIVRDYYKEYGPDGSDGSRYLVSNAYAAARKQVIEHGEVTDSYKNLWDGTELPGVKLEFAGRLDGWIRLTHFAGYLPTDLNELRDTLLGEPYDRLHLFYRYFVQLQADFSQKNAVKEVEHQAAWILFSANAEPDVFDLRERRGPVRQAVKQLIRDGIIKRPSNIELLQVA